MKKLLYIFWIIVVFAGCAKDDGGSNGLISLTGSSELTFAGEGQTGQTISFNAGGNWTATSDAPWCTMDRNSGAEGAASLTVTVAKNETGENRSTNITISTATSSVNITVNQSKIYVMNFTESDFVLPSNGDTITVSFSTNIDYEYLIPDEISWIKPVTKTRGIENFTHYFYVEANDTYDARSGAIAFINKDNREEKKITVMQLQKDAIIPADSVYNIGAESHVFEFGISSNVEYSISVDAEWIRCRQTETKALVNKNIQFEVEENSTFESRSATVTVKGKGIVQHVQIVQQSWPVRMTIAITHSEMEYVAPTISGRELGGTIYWGDGEKEKYESQKAHSYKTADEKKTIYDLHGNNFYSFEIPALNSIKSFAIEWSGEE